MKKKGSVYISNQNKLDKEDVFVQTPPAEHHGNLFHHISNRNNMIYTWSNVRMKRNTLQPAKIDLFYVFPPFWFNSTAPRCCCLSRHDIMLKWMCFFVSGQRQPLLLQGNSAIYSNTEWKTWLYYMTALIQYPTLKKYWSYLHLFRKNMLSIYC